MASEKTASTEVPPEAEPDVVTTSAEASAAAPTTAGLQAEENAPPQPPRPLPPNSANQARLEEVFPNIDKTVVRAVLVASGGDMVPAFNALLSMSDPSAVETPPPQPQRPRAQPKPAAPAAAAAADFPTELLTSTPQSQLDADALYARQLQEHYGVAPRPHRGSSDLRQPQHAGGGRGAKPTPRRPSQDDSDDEYYYDDDKDRPSFFEEDLPVIKENIKKGFLETQTKVTGWFNEFKKRIDGESPETSPPQTARPTSGQFARTATRRPTGFPGLESGGRARDPTYDADPKVLSDDFTHLGLKDNTASESAPRRPKANPNLFQPSATTGRRVSFDDRPTTIDNDDDLYRPSSAAAKRSSASPVRQPSPVGNSKWEPLKSTEPGPLHKDPFSLEDSDDEKDGLIKEGETGTKIPSITGPQESGVTKNP